MKMKISFDWDGTLTKDFIKHEFIKLINEGNDVRIITSRVEKVPANWHWNNDEIFELAKSFDIPVHFTNGENKWMLIKELGIERHFDDDEIEIEFIHENTNCKCIYVPYVIH